MMGCLQMWAITGRVLATERNPVVAGTANIKISATSTHDLAISEPIANTKFSAASTHDLLSRDFGELFNPTKHVPNIYI